MMKAAYIVEKVPLYTAVRKGEFQKEIVTQKLTPRGLLGWFKCPKSVVRKIAVAWP